MTESAGKVRFASNEWLAAAQAIAETLLAEANGALDSYALRCCEVFINVPPDLSGARPDGTRAWNWEMRNGKATVRDGERDDVDFKVYADYEGILPLARAAFDGDPEAMKSLDRHRETLMSDGRLRFIGDRSAFPAPVNAMLHAFHNRLAAQIL